VWSPDGRYVVFENGAGTLFWIRADGGGALQPLVKSGARMVPYSFSPDGKRLALASTGYDLYTVSVGNEGGSLHAGKPEPFLATSSDERSPFFAPDGKWLAYSSDESGVFQVYVRAFPNTGGKWLISNEGGVHPIWPRSGDRIFFRTKDNHVMSVAYNVNGDTFDDERPRLWTPTQMGNVGLVANYDVAADGKRVLALMETEHRNKPSGK